VVLKHDPRDELHFRWACQLRVRVLPDTPNSSSVQAEFVTSALSLGTSDRHQQTTDFGHHVERDYEIGHRGAHSCFSGDPLFLSLATYLDAIGVKGLKDLSR
jgi:hypothetical protein